MRVLHVAAGNLYGGIETSLVAMGRNVAEDLDQEVALFFEGGQLAEELSRTPMRVHVLGPVRLRYPWTVLRARRRFARILVRARCDAVVVHSPWSHAILAPVIRRSDAVFVHSVHGFLDGGHFLERWARRTRPDLVIANSAATSASVNAVFEGIPVVVIHPPVVAPSESVPSRVETRAKMGVKDDAVVVIMASRLEPWKGHTLLLQAAAELGPEFVVWIAGGAQRGSEERYLEGLRSMSGPNVRFLGHRRDVRALMAAADIHCQPNVGPEPFGIVFVEALHARLPIVTSAMGGALEIVDEQSGLLVSPDPKQVAAALRRLGSSEELRRRLGSNGPARARALCHPIQQAGKLRDAIGRVRARS